MSVYWWFLNMWVLFLLDLWSDAVGVCRSESHLVQQHLRRLFWRSPCNRPLCIGVCALVPNLSEGGRRPRAQPVRASSRHGGYIWSWFYLNVWARNTVVNPPPPIVLLKEDRFPRFKPGTNIWQSISNGAQLYVLWAKKLWKINEDINVKHINLSSPREKETSGVLLKLN